MKRRIIKETPSGSIDREAIRRAVESVHVLPSPWGGWEVQTLVKGGTLKVFQTKGEAESFANQLSKKQGLHLVIHDSRPGEYSLFNGESRPA